MRISGRGLNATVEGAQVSSFSRQMKEETYHLITIHLNQFLMKRKNSCLVIKRKLSLQRK